MKLSIIVLVLVTNTCLFAQDQKYYFYRPDNNFGSDLVFNPISQILNGGFDIFRNGGHSKDISNQPYSQGAKNVINNIFNPLDSIKKFGWKSFITTEVFPISTNTDILQYFPNYAHHLIGHGFRYVKTAEWYDYHNVKYPNAWSILTLFSYVFLNETLENGGFDEVNVDPIADMLIFNPLGILLFSTEWAKKFFSRTLQLYDWSLQPVFNISNNNIINAGDQFAAKIKLNKKYGAFFYWGISGIVGLSHQFKKGRTLSWGVGTIVNKLIERKLINSKYVSRFVAPNKIDGAVGFFYDVNNSLMTSMIFTGPHSYNYRLNIYPGFIKKDWFKPGLFLSVGELDKFQIGLTLASMPIVPGFGD